MWTVQTQGMDINRVTGLGPAISVDRSNPKDGHKQGDRTRVCNKCGPDFPLEL